MQIDIWTEKVICCLLHVMVTVFLQMSKYTTRSLFVAFSLKMVKLSHNCSMLTKEMKYIEIFLLSMMITRSPPPHPPSHCYGQWGWGSSGIAPIISKKSLPFEIFWQELFCHIHCSCHCHCLCLFVCPHHFDQINQRSKALRIAPWGCSLNIFIIFSVFRFPDIFHHIWGIQWGY